MHFVHKNPFSLFYFSCKDFFIQEHYIWVRVAKKELKLLLKFYSAVQMHSQEKYFEIKLFIIQTRTYILFTLCHLSYITCFLTYIHLFKIKLNK